MYTSMTRIPVVGLIALFACCCDQKPKDTAPQQSTTKDIPRTDLPGMREAGEVRVLLFKPEGGEVPREGASKAADAGLFEAMAGKVGVKVQVVYVKQRSGLVPALREGKGDLIGTVLRADREVEGLSFSVPVRHADEVVVGRKGAKPLPKKAEDLKKFKIFLPARSASRDTLAQAGQELDIQTAPKNQDTDDILFSVGSGEYPLTVALSDRVEDYLAYRDDVKVTLVLREKVPLAWAVRKESKQLLEAVNGFLYEHALTTHRRDRYGGDIEEIKRRRVLRVGMLNNSVAYFIYRGQEVGFQFELAETLARRLGVRLEVVVPERPVDLTRLLVENLADVAVVSPLPTDPHADQVVFSQPFSFADQVLVQPAGQKPISEISQLAGKRVHVRRSSQYFETLRRAAKSLPTMEIVEADESLETEELIDMVGKNEIPLTVANSILLDVEKTYRDDIQGSLVFAKKKPLVFAVRNSSPRLLSRMNRFVADDCGGPGFEALYDKYFKESKHMVEVRTDALAASGTISPYDELVKKYGSMYGIDWRLVLAQMYQESRFDPRAKSWAGAMGLLQVMPQTAAELGAGDPWDPESNIRTGVKYLSWLLMRFEPSLPMRQRVRFALASYNAGLGHIRDARRLARERGLDPDRWFGNVEKAVVLLEKQNFYKRARHGYCRGTEPVQYVSHIQSKYDAYSRLMPAEGK
jgi:membrane-bound lytic murein transglycosylase F